MENVKGKGKQKMTTTNVKAGSVEKKAATTGKGCPPEEQDREAYFKYVRENKMKLDPNGEKASRLSFVVHTLDIKKQCGMSKESISALFALTKQAFPKDKEFPGSYDDAVKLIHNSGGATYFSDLL